MGCIQSTGIDDEVLSQRNNQIERQLEADRLKGKNEVRMLVLSIGDAGEAAFLKQVKFIHHGGFNDSERYSYKEIIYSYIIRSMQAVLKVLPELELSLASKNDAHRAVILSLPTKLESDILPWDVGYSIRSLWRDPAVQEAMRRRRKFDVKDSAAYFFDAIDRVSSPSYLPTDPDILRCEKEGTGITETTFTTGQLTYKLFSVGFRTSQSRLWIRYVANVKALVFVVSLKEYDHVLFDGVSRLHEAFAYFSSLCTSRWFTNTPIILILNDADLFAEKLPHSPLGDYFPDYQGGDDYEAACDFILRRFTTLNVNPVSRPVYAHCTTVSNTEQFKDVLTSIQEVVVDQD